LGFDRRISGDWVASQERGESREKRRLLRTADAARGVPTYDAAIMGQSDEQKERRRLADLYASLEEGELKGDCGRRGLLDRSGGTRSTAVGDAAPRDASDAGRKRRTSETPRRGSEEARGPVMVGRYRDSGEAMIAKSMLDSRGSSAFWAMKILCE